MARTGSISGTVLVVAASDETDALIDEPLVGAAGLGLERALDAGAAIARVEEGATFDVVLLAPRLPDPVRVAQRLHSLDRLGAVVVLSDAGAEAELRHALDVAPFLDGDVSLVATSDPSALVDHLAAAAERTRIRRGGVAALKRRRETPPPLSARYLGTLLDSVPIGVVTLDAGGAVIGWNRRAGEMLGVPEVEALGTPFTELFAEADRPRLVELIAGLRGEGINDEGQVLERDGHAYEVTGARFAIRSGEEGSLLILQDVTKRQAAERELELQVALSDAQSESAVAGIVVTSPDGAFRRANRRFAEIWGVDQQQMGADQLASRNRILEQVEDPEAFMGAVGELLAAGEGTFRDEVRLKDGRIVERYAAHAHGPDGQVIGLIWFHTDITERKREEEALRFLGDATNLLSSSLDYETTLQRVADLAVMRIADWCSVEIAEQGRNRTVAIAHVDPAKVELARHFRTRYPDVESGAVGRVVTSGESFVVAELSDADLEALTRDPAHLDLLRELGLRSVMIVPIKVRERVFGAINFIRSAPGHPYDRDDLALAEELARRAAIAMDNSRVHAELRQTARTLQESLLPPHLPVARGLELAARFRPAGAGMQVGGDFYDIFEIGENQWAVAVGDVCGKGAEAAALTALTRYTVRVAATYEEEAGGVLRVLNEALLRQRGDFRFTTLAVCVLELGGERPVLRAASGGHPRPLLLRRDGTTEAVGALGPLLGVVHRAGFGEQRIELEDGDAIVLHTDGLTDAFAPQRLLGESDVLAALAGCAGVSAGEICARLESFAIEDAAGRDPRDDIAIVVARLER